MLMLSCRCQDGKCPSCQARIVACHDLAFHPAGTVSVFWLFHSSVHSFFGSAMMGMPSFPCFSGGYRLITVATVWSAGMGSSPTAPYRAA